MKTEIKKLWVAALRSGEYKQTIGKLQDIYGFCCLGVLCEISMAETRFGLAENRLDYGHFDLLGYTVRNWAGLFGGEGDMVTINGEVGSLANHNDNGATFLQIADAIEAQL